MVIPTETKIVAYNQTTNFFWPHHTAGFLGGSVVKNLPANTGDSSLIPGSGRSPGEGNGNPLQYSCLGNSIDRVHGVIKSQIGLNSCTYTASPTRQGKGIAIPATCFR